MIVEEATPDDAEEILALQKAAYASEGPRIYGEEEPVITGFF